MDVLSHLLCTFTKKHRLTDTLNLIVDTYNITFNKVFVLQDVENPSSLMCTYNVNHSDGEEFFVLENTISLHRKKQTNTLYTINALNEVVTLLNDGKQDSSFKVPWENYENTVLVTADGGLKRINTRIFDIIKIEE